MKITDDIIQNHLILPRVLKYLEKIEKHPSSSNKLTGELAMAIYSGASRSPRFFKYKDAYQLAVKLVKFAQSHPKEVKKLIEQKNDN